MAMRRELIPALCERGHFDTAMEALARLDVAASTRSYLCLLRCCARENDLLQARHVQAHLFKHSAQIPGILGDFLAESLARCGAPDDALIALNSTSCRTVFSWTAIISAYAEIGDGLEALRLHHLMRQDGVECDHYTYVSLFKACGSASILEEGMQLHSEAVKKGFTADVFSERTIVSWNAMISAYMEQGHGDRALQVFADVSIAGVTPNYLSYVIALQACLTLLEKEKSFGTAGLSNKALALHIGQDCLSIPSYAVKLCSLRCELILPIATTLVHSYGSCSNMSDAQEFFAGLLDSALVLWNACIAGHTSEGNSFVCLQMFEHLCLLGILPDGVTFNSVLCACSHCGLATEGLEHFWAMKSHYGVDPDVKHYGIMLDLLARAGNFKLVESLLQKTKVQSDVSIWLSLMGASRLHGNVELAVQAFCNAVALQPKQDTAYAVMVSMYSEAQLWECC